MRRKSYFVRSFLPSAIIFRRPASIASQRERASVPLRSASRFAAVARSPVFFHRVARTSSGAGRRARPCVVPLGPRAVPRRVRRHGLQRSAAGHDRQPPQGKAGEPLLRAAGVCREQAICRGARCRRDERADAGQRTFPTPDTFDGPAFPAAHVRCTCSRTRASAFIPPSDVCRHPPAS